MDTDVLAFLSDPEKPFLHKATRDDSEKLIKKLLWVTKACLVNVRDPRYALILVIAPVVRSELDCERKVICTIVIDGIARDHIFHSHDPSFKHDILKATDSKGVDVVLNSLSGDLLHAYWKCVAPYGTMVEIDKSVLIAGGCPAINIFEQNRDYHGVGITNLGTYDAGRNR
ncbi:hypothetical protein PMIN03_006775 [Paraphaeosphaeria minitans]